MSDGVRPPPPLRTWCRSRPAPEPETGPAVDLLVVERGGGQVHDACSVGPDSVSMVPALSSTVCINGMSIAAASAVNCASASMRHRSSDSPPGPQPAQIVEPDGGVGGVEGDIGVQVPRSRP